MAAKAAKRALEDAQVAAEEIDLLIVSSVSSEQLLPCTACSVQKEIGAVNAAAFDLNAACSGFIVAYVILFVILAVLLVCEKMNPGAGSALLQGFVGAFDGQEQSDENGRGVVCFSGWFRRDGACALHGSQCRYRKHFQVHAP